MRRLGGLGVVELRIAAADLREAVMPAVVVAIEGRVVERQQAGEPADRVAEAAAAKRGAVNRLVHRGEHRDQREAEQDGGGRHEDERRGARERGPVEPAGRCDQPEVPGQTQETAAIGPLLHAAEHVRCQRRVRCFLRGRINLHAEPTARIAQRQTDRHVEPHTPQSILRGRNSREIIGPRGPWQPALTIRHILPAECPRSS